MNKIIVLLLIYLKWKFQECCHYFRINKKYTRIYNIKSIKYKLFTKVENMNYIKISFTINNIPRVMNSWRWL